ncbi:MAG: Hsp33 family molecular chaperone HslO [Deltaproteobacteria bacterium]|nr:Hsp33 family molecular chaperone HslO [Deltaproteobacteria bacterium]
MKDRVLRAITVDGGFRVIAARTTALVQEAVRVQKVHGHDAQVFGELLTGAVLVRETMAPGHRVQAILSREGRGTLIADSHPEPDPPTDPPPLSELAAQGTSAERAALTRGLVSRREDGVGLPIVSEGAVLKLIRSMPRGRLHQSIVEAGDGGINEAIMRYLQESAQVYATLGIATVVEGDRVVASGGFIVQLLPELEDGPLAVMTERLAHDFEPLADILAEHDADASWLLGELLHGMDHEILADGSLRWGCDCSQARVLGAIVTLGRDELVEIVERGEVLELTCEYCTRPWKIGAEQIRGLLTPS